ncbi:MAG: flavin reductase family protein [Cyclobacteriaceae bacterium]
MTSGVKTIDPKSLAIQELHGYLLGAVAPRPIAFASTIDSDGNVNLSPFSYFNVFSANPPVMIFSPARRSRDNTTKHTFDNIKQVPETVINIVNFPIVEQVSLASTEYDQGVNEFVKAGLTQVPSEKVRPPRVGESPVAFECLVDDVIELGQKGGAGNLIISRVVMIHIQEKYLDKEGRLDTKAIDAVGRMGGNWYCRASGDALFEIPKPLQSKGIGVDQLPDKIRLSNILTGNNLGRLGNLEYLPDVEAIEEVKNEAEVKSIMAQAGSQPEAMQEALHRLAQVYLEQGDTQKALKILMIS